MNSVAVLAGGNNGVRVDAVQVLSGGLGDATRPGVRTGTDVWTGDMIDGDET